jgi:hypothetical protein
MFPPILRGDFFYAPAPDVELIRQQFKKVKNRKSLFISFMCRYIYQLASSVGNVH